MKKQNGFTLIELVVVIVILGILAVTAAPKFLNLQDDAKVSAVKGLAGAMKGAAGITYGKAAVRGVESKATHQLDIPGVSGAVTLIYGYPAANALGIAKVVDGLQTDDWKKNPMNTDTSGMISYGYTGFDCIATYTNATSSAPASIVVKGDVDGCESMNAAN
ncbi:type II secretion system protein [Vibrio litoralis]|uniref:type II secretion system protein n=1 Tax=Vibrio litoralis TaxID=335972 RepID=UPI001866FF37|nr:prepilin-type N-terminal cleavage/methylation domain-containing protein [Vibrio litoralis]